MRRSLHSARPTLRRVRWIEQCARRTIPPDLSFRFGSANDVVGGVGIPFPPPEKILVAVQRLPDDPLLPFFFFPLLLFPQPFLRLMLLADYSNHPIFLLFKSFLLLLMLTVDLQGFLYCLLHFIIIVVVFFPFPAQLRCIERRCNRCLQIGIIVPTALPLPNIHHRPSSFVGVKANLLTFAYAVPFTSCLCENLARAFCGQQAGGSH